MTRPVILFDLDNTLYPPSSGVLPEMNRRITLFVAEYLNVDPEEAFRLRRGKTDLFGTTLQWLRVCHNLGNPDPYIDAVHPDDMENWVDSDPELRSFLSSLPLDYVLFTNSPMEHALRTLNALGLDGLFPRIWDLRRLGYRGKPFRSAYDRILGDLGLKARDALLVDDSPDNLQGFRDMGGATVSTEGKTPAEWMPALAESLDLTGVLNV